jgi:Ran GTPase-activating protein (RanGAP) involved in mRNA processing and transport
MAADTILCPIKGELAAPACPPEELRPVLDALRANTLPSAPQTFPRGTLLPDGRLDLCKQGIGVEGCAAVTAALAGNTVVRALLLGTNGIGDRGAAHVAELLDANRTLEVVYLGCNGIRAAGAECLIGRAAAHPTVTGLWLKRNPIGADGLRAVARLVREQTAVRVLDLVNTAPGEPALGDVIDALARADGPCAVEQVYLGGNALTAAVAPRLAALVRANQNLRGLFLAANRLGDAGAAELAAGLARNRGLRALSLASNGLGPAGISALAGALVGHPNLCWLDLGYAPSTRALDCAANDATGVAVGALADLIAGAPRLAELNVSRSGLSTTDLNRLAPAVARSPALISVKYTGPRAAALDAALANRRASSGWHPPPRPDVALIRSVYR